MPPRAGPILVYIAAMPAPAPGTQERTQETRGFVRRLLPLLVILVAAAAVYLTVGQGMISLESLVQHRAAIDHFVMSHRLLAVLAYIALYTVAVALSLPGATFLTVSGGFLFGLALGAGAAVIGATAGATVIFLVARTALGEPLLKRAGPRALKLAENFREDAFSYLLFLRLVPAFPFFLVNLVPAFAGVRLLPFVAATALGIIPGAVAYAFAGTGLDSVIAAQRHAYEACMAAGHADCHLTFDASAILTPELLGALGALALLALVPVAVKRLRGRTHAPSRDF
jgi:uncharacterized membrane protein YdjX (TVP38/TMEM64 family)